MILNLIRHGECSNSKNINGSSSDFSLTELGKSQIGNLKAEYRDRFIFTSDLKRAIESTTILTDNYIAIEGFKEIDFGSWDGRHSTIIREEFPVLWGNWVENPIDCSPIDGENLKEFYNRVKKALDSIIDYDENEINILCHGGVIRIILIYLLKLDLKDFWIFRIDFGSVTSLEVVDDFAQLIFSNKTIF